VLILEGLVQSHHLEDEGLNEGLTLFGYYNPLMFAHPPIVLNDLNIETVSFKEGGVEQLPDLSLSLTRCAMDI